MRFRLTLLLLLFSVSVYAQTQVKVVSWNLKDFGKSKTDAEISMIADLTRGFDLLAIQEVVAGAGGPQAVARLADELNRKGERWDYAISELTSGSSAHKSERFAFLWKRSRLKLLGKPWLEARYGMLIEREPFYARFIAGRQIFTLSNFHAITKSQQPEREIKYFKFLPAAYAGDNLVFCGDFNVPQSHSVFNSLKKIGYLAALKNQKTSLRQRCIGEDCLSSEFDNFYYNGSKIRLQSAGVMHFYRRFKDIKLARKLSDHIPIFVVFHF